MKTNARLSHVWKLGEYAIAHFIVNGLQWRIRFAISSASWLQEHIGHHFLACQSGGETFIHVHGVLKPGIQAHRGI